MSIVFKDYQSQAREFATYPGIGSNVLYPCLGLAGESGELIDKIKKIYRNREVSEVTGFTTDEILEIKKEMGDVLWYLSNLASEFNLELTDVAQLNIDKLTDRRNRGVIKSQGDNR